MLFADRGRNVEHWLMSADDGSLSWLTVNEEDGDALPSETGRALLFTPLGTRWSGISITRQCTQLLVLTGSKMGKHGVTGVLISSQVQLGPFYPFR